MARDVIPNAALCPLPASFYNRPTELVARELLGAVLECRAGGAVTRGLIVETEAYPGPHDPACHAAAGLTPRNRQLFGPPGTVYVYFIYGVHWMVNAVTREEGYGSAVLIRAVEPVSGLHLMRRRRGSVSDRALTDGPGKLCQAFGIGARHNGTSLISGPVRILAGEAVPAREVVVTPRIGITKAADWPLRFLVRRGVDRVRSPRSRR
ncbi:MAG: putative 3-methyladenine DNA glycosylase [Gemmatimonadaceae bacterium]|nr:putative 3-methyladenine DNA glycosylase [Gemmatimonadaceae bacterium]